MINRWLEMVAKGHGKIGLCGILIVSMLIGLLGMESSSFQSHADPNQPDYEGEETYHIDNSDIEDQGQDSIDGDSVENDYAMILEDEEKAETAPDISGADADPDREAGDVPDDQLFGLNDVNATSQYEEMVYDGSEEDPNVSFISESEDIDYIDEYTLDAITDEGDIKITVSCTDTAFSVPVNLVIAPVDQDYVLAAINDRVKNICGMSVVDISFEDEYGNEVEPSENIKVMIEAFDPVEGDQYMLVHVDDDGEAFRVDDQKIVELTEETAVFYAERFSAYAILSIREEEFVEDGSSPVVTDTENVVAYDKIDNAFEMEEIENDDDYPAGKLEGITASGISVYVSYGAGVFPQSVAMSVTDVDTDDCMTAIEDMDEAIVDLAAVEISFFDNNNLEIEPKGDVSVHMVLSDPLTDTGQFKIAHVDDSGNVSVVDSDSIGNASSEEAVFSVDEFSPYILMSVLDESNSTTAQFAQPLPLPSLTGDWRTDFVEVAKSQLGYREAEDGSSFYGDWLEQTFRPWCSEFVAWCGYSANIPAAIIPHKHSSKRYIEFYAPRGRYHYIEGGISASGLQYMGEFSDSNISTISPSSLEYGDIVLVETNDNTDDGPDHTAIFLSYDNAGKVEYISGNDSDTVKISTKELTKIHGVCKPNFANVEEEQADFQDTAETIRVKYDVNFGQTSARGMLNDLNQWRTGNTWYWNSDNQTKTTINTGDREALIYDYTLEKIAMQRAVEQALLYGHERPDSTRWFTAYDEISPGFDPMSYGENLAAGY